MSLRSVTVSTRNLIGFGVLTLILLFTGGVALKSLSNLHDELNEVKDVWMLGLDLMAKIKSDRQSMRLAEYEASVQPSELASLRSEIDSIRQRVTGYDKAYEDTIILDEDRRLFTAYHAKSAAYEQTLGQVLAALAAGPVDASLSKQSEGQFDELVTALDQLIALNNKGAADAGARAEANAKSSTWTFSLILGVSVIFTLLAAWLLSRSITQPLADLARSAQRIASGDLTQPVGAEGADEVTQVQRSLGDMQTTLRDTLQSIQNSATQLASAAEELHAVTEDSSQGITRQNDEIEMAATAVTEMSAAVDEVARNANHTSDSSREAEQTALTGRQQVSTTRSTIEQLSERLQITSTTIARLAEEAIGIGRVLEVIRTIAEQTNLLALNAAIEAARAGDQGRGFAVVADEVRALAQRTQTSTQEIERMISAIQNASQESVNAMAQSSEYAVRSQSLASEADGALEVISARVSQINEMNLVIASAAEEQAQVAREVDRNLVAIRDIAAQNATGAHQTSVASDQLARLASELNGMVQRFRL
ncbi:methyl-accepting chemotaxis protein [Aquipseudomonas ullengensis]|uniref:Methyl-accepting chemotaxis protein n=1 Tax=Aquipseudomonas ullengensis TaxID=2759166 RepID=A0A7W4Q928_9GAMM|nr:methyl-accepting chemotaxis protein [Pseudomonas ullengensis]MBB2494387.1 methyl-accepting chemotaxis protein [Pseudomonas ullengensis]